jgi:hypothetical protein
MRKGKDPEQDPYLLLIGTDPDPEGPKYADPANPADPVPDPDPQHCLKYTTYVEKIYRCTCTVQ